MSYWHENAASRAHRDFLKFVEAGKSSYRRGDIVVDRSPATRVSLGGAHEPWTLPPGCEARAYPLDDAEWREWLRSSTR